MYEKKIHALEIMAGRYRYLEELAAAFAAKFSAYDNGHPYLTAVDPHLYNDLPRLGFTVGRGTAFQVTANVFLAGEVFEYQLVTRIGKLPAARTLCSADDIMEKFEDSLREDMKRYMREVGRKTLKDIDALPG